MYLPTVVPASSQGPHNAGQTRGPTWEWDGTERGRAVPSGHPDEGPHLCGSRSCDGVRMQAALLSRQPSSRSEKGVSRTIGERRLCVLMRSKRLYVIPVVMVA